MIYCNVKHIIHSLFDHISKLTVGQRAHLPLCQLLARVVRSFPLSDALAARRLSTAGRDFGVVRARSDGDDGWRVAVRGWLSAGTAGLDDGWL